MWGTRGSARASVNADDVPKVRSEGTQKLGRPPRGGTIQILSTHAEGRGCYRWVGGEDGLAVHAVPKDDQDHDAEELGRGFPQVLAKMKACEESEARAM